MENRTIEVTHTITDIQFDQDNNALFMKSLATIDPMLWRIKKYLIEYQVNPEVIPAVIEQLARVNQGSGYGAVTVIIKDHVAIKAEGLDSKLLNLAI